VRLPNRAFSANPVLALNTQAFPGVAGLYVIFFPDEVDGRRVVFVGERAHVEEARREGGRIASILVPPREGEPEPPFRMRLPSGG
jgi:hypothetical protein